MSTVQSLWVVCLAGLCACEGAPGEARIELYEPATAESRWRDTLPGQEIALEQGASEGLLRVSVSDYCWTSSLVVDYELDTGRERSVEERGSNAGTSGGRPVLDPPSPCPDFGVQRLTLSSGELVDLCSGLDDGLAVLTVPDGGERLRLGGSGSRETHVAGDQLFIRNAIGTTTVESYSLLSGVQLWSWTAPDGDNTDMSGADTERLYLHSWFTRQSFALTLIDGTVVWQKNLGCESLSLAHDALVCHETLRGSSCDHE